MFDPDIRPRLDEEFELRMRLARLGVHATKRRRRSPQIEALNGRLAKLGVAARVSPLAGGRAPLLPRVDAPEVATAPSVSARAERKPIIRPVTRHTRYYEDGFTLG